MKSKIYVQVLREQTERAVMVLSEFLQRKGEKVAFALYEKNDLIFENPDGTKDVYYGLILEMESELLGSKKLYFRKYPLKNASLSDMQKAAFEELFNIIMGTFLSTAATASDEVLKKLSTTKE